MGVPFSKLIQNEQEYDVTDKVTQTMVAPIFVSGTYKKGALVIKDDVLYVANSTHTGDWDASDFTAIGSVSNYLMKKPVIESSGIILPEGGYETAPIGGAIIKAKFGSQTGQTIEICWNQSSTTPIFKKSNTSANEVYSFYIPEGVTFNVRTMGVGCEVEYQNAYLSYN